MPPVNCDANCSCDCTNRRRLARRCLALGPTFVFSPFPGVVAGVRGSISPRISRSGRAPRSRGIQSMSKVCSATVATLNVVVCINVTVGARKVKLTTVVADVGVTALFFEVCTLRGRRRGFIGMSPSVLGRIFDALRRHLSQTLERFLGSNFPRLLLQYSDAFLVVPGSFSARNQPIVDSCPCNNQNAHWCRRGLRCLIWHGLLRRVLRAYGGKPGSCTCEHVDSDTPVSPSMGGRVNLTSWKREFVPGDPDNVACLLLRRPEQSRMFTS